MFNFKYLCKGKFTWRIMSTISSTWFGRHTTLAASLWENYEHLERSWVCVSMYQVVSVGHASFHMWTGPCKRCWNLEERIDICRTLASSQQFFTRWNIWLHHPPMLILLGDQGRSVFIFKMISYLGSIQNNWYWWLVVSNWLCPAGQEDDGRWKLSDTWLTCLRKKENSASVSKEMILFCLR